MFEKFCEQLIKELGATGILILGLFFILNSTSNKLCASLKIINDELKEIIKLLNALVWKEGKNRNGKD
jgi:hypothetical protein